VPSSPKEECERINVERGGKGEAQRWGNVTKLQKRGEGRRGVKKGERKKKVGWGTTEDILLKGLESS